MKELGLCSTELSETRNSFDFLDCKSFKSDIKITLPHSHSEIAKASLLKDLSSAVRGYLVSAYQKKLQSETQIVYSTGKASSFNCYCTSGD